MSEPELRPRFWKNSSVYILFLIGLVVGLFIFATYHFDQIKRTVQIRLYSVTSESIVRREEIKEIANQAITQIITEKQVAIADLDNKTKEIEEIDNSTRSNVVVSDEVLAAINDARRETK